MNPSAFTNVPAPATLPPVSDAALNTGLVSRFLFALEGGNSASSTTELAQQDLAEVMSEEPAKVRVENIGTVPPVPRPPNDETEKFRRADAETYAMLEKLVSSVPQVAHLARFAVSILFKRPGKRPRKEGSKFTAGEARRFSEKDSLYHGFTFEIWLDETFWIDNPDKREALLLHEMLHCGQDEEGDPKMIDHDVTEFSTVIKHYGLWEPGVEKFGNEVIRSVKA